MRSKLMIGITAVLAFAGAAIAQPYEFRSAVASGAFANPTSWEYLNENNFPATWDPATDISASPVSGDMATILSGDVITVGANAAVAVLVVDTGGAMTVNNGYALTIGSSAGISGTMYVDGTVNSGGPVSVAGTTYVDGTLTANGSISVAGLLDIGGAAYANAGGTISSGGVVDISGGLYDASATTTISGGGLMKMSVSGAILRLNNSNAVDLPSFTSLLWVAANGTIDGTGSLRGQNAAVIAISDTSASATLNLEAEIHGLLTIQRYSGASSAAFYNSGVVRADASGILALEQNVAVSDDNSDTCAAPHWRVSTGSSVLEFKQAATSLVGDFLVDAGELRCTANVSTTRYARFINGGSYTGSFSSAGSCTP